MSNSTVLLLPHQERFLQSPSNFPEVRWHFLLAGYGAGKALYYKEITPTPDGFREFGDLRVGDMVFDDGGRPVSVLGVYEQGLLDAYRVTLSDGRNVICSAEHLWGVYYNSHGGFRYKVMELSEMLRKGVRRPDPRYTKAGGKPKFWIPASPVCFYPDRELPLDPYVLGSLIGNGCLTLPALTLSSSDEWQVRKVASRLGAEPRKNKCTYSWTFRRDGHNIKTSDVVPEGLRCLAGHKYIPEEYLMSGEDQRRELLQGLFDTDGSVDASANRLHVSYSTTSRRLAEDVRNLLLSMGIVSTITEDVREGKNTCYNVIVSTSRERKAWLFSLPRKLSRVTSFPRPDRRDYTKVAVYSVEKLPEKLPMRCIRVDSPEGLFLCRDFIVTHNTRSLAITALSLISEYDGEKDDGGLGVRLAVAGYTYAHLEQTFMIDFKAYLDTSKTPYHEDTKNHIITVGTVQVIFLQLCEPARIFGQSVHCLVGNTKCLTRQMNGDILYKKLRNVRAGDVVLTRAGWRTVRAFMNNGRKRVISGAGVVGTPDHRIPTMCQQDVQLHDINRSTYFGVSKRKVCLWEGLNQKLEALVRTLSILMECATTDTPTVLDMTGAVITGVRAISRCTGLYGKKLTGPFLRDMSYIIRTGTLLTTLLRILSVCQRLRTARTTGRSMAVTCMLRLRLRLCVTYVGHISRVLQATGSISHAPSIARTSLSELCSDTSALLTMCLRSSRENLPDTRSLVLIVARCSALLRQQLDSALKSAGMLIHGEREKPRSRKTGTTLLPVPFVARSSSPVTRIADFVRNAVLICTGGTRTVYDITVDDCHEFATHSCFVHNCALADEVDELEEDVMIEAMKSLSQRVRQVVPGHRPPFIMAASTAQGMKGFYRLYSSYKKNGVGFVLVRARTQDNWYLPRNYIEDLWKNFTETERKVYMEGEFLTVAQGRVVPGFDWDRNFVPVDMDLELRPGERVYIGQDVNSGYSRGSAWVSRDGVMWCVKSYDFPDIGAAPKVYRYDFPYQDIFWLPDVTSKDMYPQFARELRAYDIHIIHRSKSPLVEDSCFLLSKLCYTGRVKITKQASAVADALATASRDKNNKIPKGVGESSPIHMLDGARYATSYMALVLPEYRDVRGGLMQHLASYRRSLEEDGDNDAPVRYNGAGYTQIEGTAYM